MQITREHLIPEGRKRCETLVTLMDVLEDLIVDARGLDPPEPMERILGALTILKKGQRLRFRIHREPFPLYRILEQNGYRWKTLRAAADDYEVLLWEP